MKVEDLIQRVLSGYSKGVQSDDSRLSSRYVYSILLTVRSRILSQKSRRKQKISDWDYTTLPCVELVVAAPHECPCLPTVGCTILKTKEPLPKPLTNFNKHIIKSVTSILAPNQDMVVYNPSTWTEQKYKAGSKYTKDTPDYWIRNGYLYTRHTKGPKVLTIEFLPEDPIKASTYPSFCGTTQSACVSMMEQEFPLELGQVDTFVKMAVEELTVLFIPSQQDIKSNSIDERAGT